ncbi:MAG: malic enzyme-like NAD(P)-binding protein [Nanoarchaeota archaeon]|nr:malic enzyme-like NAD(P)-binding protein [Nanoarchaeota archaeon]
MDYKQESLILHEKNRGKLEIRSKVAINNKTDLSLAYTPGVAQPCMEIYKDPEMVYKYTPKGNMVAVISDGSAVLGLGNIGGLASIPVMEGKAILFKNFANIDAFPICLSSQDVEENIKTIRNIAPVFGGINLEDIKAPECFIIEERLQDLGIPVMHDDQHGTAVVVLAGFINALKVAGKNLEDVKIVVNGAGAAGMAITKLIMSYGAKHVTMCDSKGIIYEGRESMNIYKDAIAKVTNREMLKGSLDVAMKGADVFIGVSVKDVVSKDMVKSMADKSIIFAMSNPDPEIRPDDAKEAGAFIVATGRSDFPNQVNNVLAFPSIFRGALDVRAERITEEMKVAAARAIASCVENPSIENIIPSPFDKEVPAKVAKAVSEAWRK